MKFTRFLTVAASALVGIAAAVPAPTLSTGTLSALKQLNNAEAFEAFTAVLDGNLPPTLAAREAGLEKRCDNWTPCMDVDTCEKNGEACVQNCSTYSSPYEQLGCIAGEFPVWLLFVGYFGSHV
ncbi:hypothetical protein BJX62DRAFT_231820 [Aspergillus germanicus]